jgi:predicted alpha-1,2-mannosidase
MECRYCANDCQKSGRQNNKVQRYYCKAFKKYQQILYRYKAELTPFRFGFNNPSAEKRIFSLKIRILVLNRICMSNNFFIKISFSTLLCFLFFLLVSYKGTIKANEKRCSSFDDPTRYADPFIGTSNSGNTYPGVVAPFGMVSVSPHTNLSQATGYTYGESSVYGFGHVHLSGIGCSDLGQIVVMPTTGKIKPDHEIHKSGFSEEEASPGYYKVLLTDYSVKAEMTCTNRTGLSKYTFPSSNDNANILFNVGQALTPTEDAYVKIISDTEVEGWNTSGNFCDAKNKQTVYFVAKLSKPAKKMGVWKDKKSFDSLQKKGIDVGAWFSFSTYEGEAILVKVGISYVSMDNARLNLQTEQPDFNFDKVKTAVKNDWQKNLSKIRVYGGTEKQKKIFYTSLYHMLIHPNILNDVNGEYPAMMSKAKMKAEGYNRYTVYSLWDTYRTVHPFFCLAYPDRQLDMVTSMLEMYKECGWLPKWELAGSETSVMVGDPAIPVIADTYIRGLIQFDTALAWKAMTKGANVTEVRNKLRPGLENYLKYGYIPQDDKGEWLWGSVSTTLEYAISDWTLAQFAEATGRENDYKEYLRRSTFYKNLYDSKTGFIRAKNKDGSWLEPFEPEAMSGGDLSFPGSGGPGYVEGNAWHYSWFVPHDVYGLMELMGGKEAFVKRLQECFDKGQYVLWNEPDMNYPFLFDYIEGQGWRTQKEVRSQLEKHFNTGPAGIPGNDDCGTISGFYVYSAMGFYPACPANPLYQLCSPIFDRIEIDLDQRYYKGKQFVIEVKNNSSGNMYIQSMTLNEKEYDKQMLSHEDIINGGTLVMQMGNKPKR